MIWKLSLTGIKSRLKDYTVLFSGLVVASMIFYMFLSLAINPGFMSKDVNAPGQYLSFIFGFGIVLLAIITFVYLVYANSFLLSMRQHDYGMFMMLGAKSSEIGLLIFCETLMTGILATVLGIVIGFGLTAIVSKLVISSLGLQITHFQIILPNAIIWTLILFVAIFFLAALRNVHKLVRSKVIDLLHEDQKPIKLSRKNGLRVVEAILGLALLAAGYYIMGMPASAIFFIIPAALVTIVAGSYFTFDSFFTLIINLFLKKKGFAYHGIRVFTLGQLKFRIRDYTRILSVISLLFALALGAITVGLNFNSLKDQAVKSSYYDATVMQNSPAVKKNMAKLDLKSKATYHYVENQKDLYFNQAELEKSPLKDIKFIQHGNNFPTYKPYTVKTKDLTNPNRYGNMLLGTMVGAGKKKINLVSADKLKTIKGQKKFVTLLTVKDFAKDYPTLMKLEKVQIAANPAMASALTGTKPFSYQMMLGFCSGFAFMGFFLGIAFLTMLASTLMFKVLSGAASDKVHYEMLYKIGSREKVLKKSIRSEIGVLFLLPSVLGVIDVLFGLRLFKALLPKPYMGIWLPFLIFIVLYFVYYAVTVKLYKNIVLKR
ncbi:FtsX-like permease family protein [Lactobacillus kefiranofaciens]|uniref:ABC transport system permease protein n=1 Tax=Lactobacillus kefiranofaciens TaxID=267818 RepID=A0AAX3UD88_9LACO|nr:FtsX-like permease family protein [Lactobacillus kefiranofaciens]AEG40945.1 ABC superfamily ATP binding cassette transporter permease protein [Lactobacillus kefiranofaciens subsp. kefiranofaciens]KRM22006.1 ABC transporter permease [Lactobacillus kefiranofaciens subsp. kefiranofaciens DSM 5016 = JCM 6985]QFQ68608.1 FtsX-like permease family protein [Lactobacillus kefiranofaciens subsp. kefiranofaciens]WGO85591.1 FtsX-like permease family protein [Lactobacillus kefiranofaciens]WQH35130.1 Fts